MWGESVNRRIDSAYNREADSKSRFGGIEGADKLHLFRWNKLPVILQAEAAECGIACLAMVAAELLGPPEERYDAN